MELVLPYRFLSCFLLDLLKDLISILDLVELDYFGLGAQLREGSLGHLAVGTGRRGDHYHRVRRQQR